MRRPNRVKEPPSGRCRLARGVSRALALAGLLVVVALPAAASTGAAAPAPDQVRVAFVYGEQLIQVSRPGATPADALAQLVAGPTAAEAKRGVRTYVPAGTTVNALTVNGDLITVDLSARFTTGGDARSRLARLSQLVRTLTGLASIQRVQLLIDGATVSGVFRGVPTASPITFALLQKPNVPVPKPRRRKLGPPDPHLKTVQQRLIELGYLRGAADGRFGPVTSDAILAFQKWERLGRTGRLDMGTESRLARASRPAPISRGGVGKRAEVLIDRQVALLIVNNKVLRAIAVSSGKPTTPTPPGNYKVYAKIPRWWSVPFREWLPWAVPFVGGIAFHEFPVVPAYPASHGCVRQAVAVARGTFDFAELGMPVKVIARS
jgi:sporulation and spore germination protein/L,D-transpeptidase-like protein/putative peptidoglycan binding protein